jgi:hypothetical protein
MEITQEDTTQRASSDLDLQLNQETTQRFITHQNDATSQSFDLQQNESPYQEVQTNYQNLDNDANTNTEIRGEIPKKNYSVMEKGSMTISLVIPDRDMGRLIGKGGSYISKIRERSGAKIQAQDRKLWFKGYGFGTENPQRLFKAYGEQEALEKVICEAAKKLSTLRRERACEVVILCPRENITASIREINNVSIMDQHEFALIIIEGFMNVIAKVAHEVLSQGIGHAVIDETKLKTHKGPRPRHRRRLEQQAQMQPAQPHMYAQQGFNPGFQQYPYPAPQNQYFNAYQGQPQQQPHQRQPRRRGRNPRENQRRNRRDRSRSNSPEINNKDKQEFLTLLNTLMNNKKNVF